MNFLWAKPVLGTALVVAAAAGPAMASVPTPATTTLTTATKNWTLTFEDAFDGDTLDPTKWDVRDQEGHCCPQELELYVKEAVSVTQGFLRIHTNRTEAPVTDPSGNVYNFTSGWVETKAHFAQRFGRFEANMSLPSTNFRGIWPAFWLMPNSTQCWPTGGEIDIMEFVGNPLGETVDRAWGSYHWQRNQSACGEDLEPLPGAPWPPLWKSVEKDWQTDFHVYGVEWTEDQLAFSVDGEETYLTRRGGDGPGEVLLPSAPMYIIFDQAVNPRLFPPHNGEPYDTHMYVDWVRVYEATP